MKFKAISVRNAMSMIRQEEMLLPPIQRSFVWDRERILKLFDSLYRDYPLGNCIFWSVTPTTAKHYPLYQFTRNFTENKREMSANVLPETLGFR